MKCDPNFTQKFIKEILFGIFDTVERDVVANFKSKLGISRQCQGH